MDRRDAADERGVLDPNTDINNYLDFAIPDTFPAPITLNHIMSHWQGSRVATSDGSLAIQVCHALSAPGLLKTFRAGCGRRAAKQAIQITAPPWRVTYVVRATGVPYAAYVERQILQPLGMTSSTARQHVPTWLPGWRVVMRLSTEN